MPGKITSVDCKVGAAVNEGDTLMVLEAMKMGNPIMAPCSGTVKSVDVTVGQNVQGGDQLAIIG
jgi:glutaconyl-CoA decarboxylase